MPNNNRKFNLKLVGFSHIEQALVAGICKLSQVRADRVSSDSYQFYIVDMDFSPDIHIYVINTDVPDTLKIRRWIQTAQPNAAVILVGKVLQEASRANEYPLGRDRLGGLLLRLLDDIITKQRASQATAIPAKTCLVVDDSELMRTQMKLLLDEHHLSAEFAPDAETALRIVREKHYDLIFLDVMLPEMDGYKACKLLKSNPTTRVTPVVMLTSKRSPFNKMHGALVGCDRYLTKPVDPGKVRDVLAQYALIELIE